MQRDPIKQYFRDPDKKAKLFVAMQLGMIASTILITIGTIIFILKLVGVF
ncbi:hypothetical protein [Methanobrevibacter curvatus]|uniref:Uncharacterized protein n=1 Tax=Methanobrevibacter curvatus TaxID=49547 RepID=A0A162FIA7_9EURY|nr:hypothetical protein [Methanobrevibacter curvatus]KZX10400.1 hypothetical protein MBCUR_17700 [Methanobrevibacter curvatus]